MRPSLKAVLTGATIALLATGTTACGGSDSGSSGRPDADNAQNAGGFGGDAVQAVQALVVAAETTEEITSADFEAVTTSPGSGGEEVEISGSLSWGENLAMEMTMSGDQLALGGNAAAAPEEVSVVWLDGVMYMDMGPEFATEFGGREWMRMDLMDIAEQTGDEELTGAMSQGLDQGNQDPAQQMALLLESPDIDLVGEETLNGSPVDHYQGTISIEDALESGDGGADLLTERQRDEIIDTMRELDVDSYDIDVWVDENDFPVRIRQSYDTGMGPVESEVTYSNLGTEVSVAAPPAEDTLDFMDLLGEMESGM
jgi:hypothetical protein